MDQHKVFYYPYSYFADNQSPVLKLAAIYFDKIYILDPELAHHDGIGISNGMKYNVTQLEDAGILERVTPTEVFQSKENVDYQQLITEGIKSDLADPEFQQLCQTNQKQGWNISLAKIPEEYRNDPKKRDDEMRQMLRVGGQYGEIYHGVNQYDEVIYDEVRDGRIEYRVTQGYESVDLAFGEAVMMNHALVSGLLYKGATPITNDPFHHEIFQLKISRALSNPLVQEVLEDNYSAAQIK